MRAAAATVGATMYPARQRINRTLSPGALGLIVVSTLNLGHLVLLIGLSLFVSASRLSSPGLTLEVNTRGMKADSECDGGVSWGLTGATPRR